MSLHDDCSLHNREENWQAFLAQQVQPVWQQYVEEFVVKTQDNIELHGVTIHHPQAVRNVVLIPGRVETYKKYQEVCFDLFQQGCNIFSIDHRGQGFSQRLLSDPEKGYVRDFADYAKDLHFALQHTGFIENKLPTACIAHSMGSAIALNWIEQYQPQLDKLVLCAPMLGINAGPLPQSCALSVASLADFLGRKLFSEVPYFIGQQPYNRPEFEGNVLSHSRVRFEYVQDMQAQCRLGGVTTSWLYQALKLIKRLPQIGQQLSCETLLLQAENDVVVSLMAQDKWCEQAGKVHDRVNKRIVKGAKHEILMEKDEIRAPIMQEILYFIR
ncbi:alpha/beta fold hydrolase [Catenovulum sediminis]|uniref:alpha/beta fold hydrolase n=1 Tax=Catenovulum sediminis TaxID=1740262 RepID=UPI00117E607F|nr:alpha/beta fold hydrolase [Catenovulum sediminis]